MLDGISITCFAASYSVALGLEISRLFFRSGVRGAVMLGFAGAGLVAHTLFLCYRAATATGAPLSSEFDWYLMAAWVLAALYLVLTYYHPKQTIGLFLLPLVLVLVGAANWLGSQTPLSRQDARMAWIVVHVSFQMAGTVAVLVGFAGGVMCLLQSYRLKNKVLSTGRLRLPSLEWLERLNARALLWSAGLLGLGYLSGIILNMVANERVRWSDPVVWRSGLLMLWLLAAVLFMAIYEPARQARKSAYLTIATFVLLLISLSVEWWLPGEHGGQQISGAQQASPAASDVPPRIAGGGA